MTVSRESVERRLAAILFTDVVDYTALVARDEQGGRRVRRRHEELVREEVARHHGRWIEEKGDESLSIFPSALDAVHCGLAIQERLVGDAELSLRIGVHLGDVTIEAGRIYGDGVNVAARVRPLAEAGGVCISAPVYDSIKNQPGLIATPLGEQHLKGVAAPLAVYALAGSVAAPTSGPDSPLDVPSLAGPERPTGAFLSGQRGVVRGSLAAVAACVLVAAAWLLLDGRSELITSSPEIDPSVNFWDRPAIAVLPFDNLSGDPAQDYLADGLTEDLITRLALARALPVIARNSTFVYKGKAVDIVQVSRDLDAAFVVEGSIQRDGDTIRVHAQLLHGTTGGHLWAKKYQYEIDDVFRVQDEITTEISRSLGTSLRAELERESLRAPADMGAWDLALRGSHHAGRGEYDEAIAFYERAIVASPGWSQPYSGLAITLFRAFLVNPAQPRETFERAVEVARRSRDLEPHAAASHFAVGLVNFWFDLGAAEASFRRAIELSPDVGQAQLGQVLVFLGRHTEAIPHIKRSLRIDPADESSVSALAEAYYMAARYQDAEEVLQRLLRTQTVAIPRVHMLMAAIYGQLGKQQNARRAIARALELAPGYSTDVTPLLRAGASPEWEEHWQDGLEKAGWVEAAAAS
jgi:adenylate cyclase